MICGSNVVAIKTIDFFRSYNVQRFLMEHSKL
jgi:hypothetical protein